MLNITLFVPRCAPDGTLISAAHERTLERYMVELFGRFVRQVPAPVGWTADGDPRQEELTRYTVQLSSITDGGKILDFARVVYALVGAPAVAIEFGTHTEMVVVGTAEPVSVAPATEIDLPTWEVA